MYTFGCFYVHCQVRTCSLFLVLVLVVAFPVSRNWARIGIALCTGPPGCVHRVFGSVTIVLAWGSVVLVSGLTDS